MDYLKIKNWKKFQHYNDRNPPWIKLHFEILSSRDWVMLDDASRVLAVASMLIASKNDGQVPNDPHYMQRVAYLNAPANFKPLIKCGFFENMLADASTLQADARPETETYRKEKETEVKTILPDWLPTDDWHDWISQRKKKPSPRALELSLKKLSDFRDEGIAPEIVLQHCIMNGYQGLFKPTATNSKLSYSKPTPAKQVSGIKTLY